MKTLYRFYVSVLNRLQCIFLLIIRAYWGWSFLQAGRGKFGNMEKVVSTFTELGIPYPAANVYLVASVETICGFLLIVGFLSRIITLPLVITMIVALLTAHADATYGIFTDPDTFFEQAPFLFLYASLIVLLFGPGRISVDHLLAKIKGDK